MLPLDQLERMDDLSAAALYDAEVKQIPLLPREDQPPYIIQAQAGDVVAQHVLLHNCLNWMKRQAKTIYLDRMPRHTDLMDLISHANVKMLEAMPCALAANDPISYLMTVGANEMRWYCLYHDPLVTRKRDEPLTYSHPGTVSLEASNEALAEQAACPAAQPEYKVVYRTLAQLSKRHRIVLTYAYGLNGDKKLCNEDIAAELHLPKETIEKYLWRAKRRLAAKLGSYAAAKGLKQ
jgi:DNA-directed RNA polymerase specialized sigma24 family protein